MHLKKSEDQIGEESVGFSADFRPPHILQIRISNPNPNPNHGFSLQSNPHKRPIMNSPNPNPNKTVPRSAIRLPASSPSRISLRHLLRRIRFRLRLVFLLFFPSFGFLLVAFRSASYSGSFLLLVFLSAVGFLSAILFLLLFYLKLFSISSIRLLLSRSSSLLSRYYWISPPSVEWSIGSTIEKCKSGIGTASGLSVEVYSNGDVFEGEFHKGRYSGSGVYYYYLSGRYEGDWVDNKYDGYGIETWARGSCYKGQYRKGFRHGFGVYRFYNGDVYTGEWWNGYIHGYGLHRCKDGSRYVGHFKFGVKHGIGHYHFRNGDTYAGEYFADKMHGFGVYHFANGHRYEGAWHEGRRQGMGMYIFRNGETQAGHWQNGALNILSTQNSLPASPVAVNQSKVLNAVQEARQAAERAKDLPGFDGKINKIVLAAKTAANAARVTAAKAVQWHGPSSRGEFLTPPV